MIFKVISHFLLNRTYLIAGSSNINSSETLAEKTAVFSRKTVDFRISSIYYNQIYRLWNIIQFWLV